MQLASTEIAEQAFRLTKSLPLLFRRPALMSSLYVLTVVVVTAHYSL